MLHSDFFENIYYYFEFPQFLHFFKKRIYTSRKTTNLKRVSTLSSPITPNPATSIFTCVHRFPTHTMPRHRSHESFAGRGLRVPHRRQEVLAPIRPMRVVARPGDLVHQDPTRVTRICTRPEHPCASRDGL